MPFSLRLEDGIVIGTCAGALRLDEAKAGAQAFWANPEWKGKAIVWDFRMAELKVEVDQVRELASFILYSQTSPPPKVAFVTGREVDHGMVRIFEVFRERPATKVRAFRDYQTALDWAREPTE